MPDDGSILVLFRLRKSLSSIVPQLLKSSYFSVYLCVCADGFVASALNRWCPGFVISFYDVLIAVLTQELGCKAVL